MLLSIADRLADTTAPADRQHALAARVNRLWRYDIGGLERSGQSEEILGFVEAIATAAHTHDTDETGGLMYLNAGLLNFRTLFPERAARLASLPAMKAFNEAVLSWHQRGRGARKWQTIAAAAEHIGLRRDAEQIRYLWEDAQPDRRERKKRGPQPGD